MVYLYHWTLSGEIACYPKDVNIEGNLLTLDGDKYDDLIKLLTLEGQWMFDPLCKQQGRNNHSSMLLYNMIIIVIIP